MVLECVHVVQDLRVLWVDASRPDWDAVLFIDHTRIYPEWHKHTINTIITCIHAQRCRQTTMERRSTVSSMRLAEKWSHPST